MMLLSFEYLYTKHNIQHRDLKPNNILVDKISREEKEMFIIKIIDFGMAK